MNGIRQNTPLDTLVAVHDVGAMGYFSERELIELAGLVSPEVVPIIREESKLSNFLNKRGADYLVVFPGWYQSLANCLCVEYVTSGSFSLTAGGENMVVFSWGAASQPVNYCQK